MKLHQFFLLLSIATLLVFCDSNNPNTSQKDKCKYGAPKAIFSDTISSLASHQFNLEGQVGTEYLVFQDGKKLEIVQSGCDQIQQEFQFNLAKEETDAEKNWIKEAAMQLQALGSLGEAYLSFNFWAQAIQENQQRIQLGETVELATNFSMKIDHIKGNDYNLLLITVKGT